MLTARAVTRFEPSSSWVYHDCGFPALLLILLTSLQCHVLGRSGSADTRSGVGHRLAGTSELSQCVAYHLGDYLDIDEVLAVVDSYCGAYHLRQDVHASAMRPDDPAVARAYSFEELLAFGTEAACL